MILLPSQVSNVLCHVHSLIVHQFESFGWPMLHDHVRNRHIFKCFKCGLPCLSHLKLGDRFGLRKFRINLADLVSAVPFLTCPEKRSQARTPTGVIQMVVVGAFPLVWGIWALAVNLQLIHISNKNLMDYIGTNRFCCRRVWGPQVGRLIITILLVNVPATLFLAFTAEVRILR